MEVRSEQDTLRRHTGVEAALLDVRWLDCRVA
jgi:hypothetical protein